MDADDVRGGKAGDLDVLRRGGAQRHLRAAAAGEKLQIDPVVHGGADLGGVDDLLTQQEKRPGVAADKVKVAVLQIICVSGTDIRDISRISLRRSYGMVLQDTWLKSGTIYENIAYGRPDATKEQVIEAAKAAHAHSFIKRLPDGYDTVISEDGGNISQGQKQLLCIARVMLCLPPMLILDEATSSIDTRTEIKIQQAFASMMKGRTSFIVAHRLSTIREADIILVMDSGKVIEQGTHEELLAEKGFYAKLYNSQYEL